MKIMATLEDQFAKELRHCPLVEKTARRLDDHRRGPESDDDAQIEKRTQNPSSPYGH
ncbi:hypothetical protein PGT21_033571 [Puccinia graminis f. sp. tritici]|nr:hypothetical protein PGT21_033571 [Puccinia graminis f. sp. tritici]